MRSGRSCMRDGKMYNAGPDSIECSSACGTPINAQHEMFPVPVRPPLPPFECALPYARALSNRLASTLNGWPRLPSPKPLRRAPSR
jgi:hypothetical protein